MLTYIIRYCNIEGEYIEQTQTINVMIPNELPYGIDKDYLEIVRPSGIVRSWIGVNTDSPRAGVDITFSLLVHC